MSEKIFREESLKKVKSPEELNDYIKTTNPGVWLLLVGIIILLVGFVAWGYLGAIETKVETAAVVEKNQTVVYVDEETFEKINESNVIRINGNEVAIKQINNTPIVIDDSFSEYACHLGGFDKGEWVYKIVVDAHLNEGVYKTEVVVDSVNPISFVFN